MTGSRCEPDSFQSRVLTYLPDFKEILENTPRLLELSETHQSRFISKLTACRERDRARVDKPQLKLFLGLVVQCYQIFHYKPFIMRKLGYFLVTFVLEQ